MRRMVDAAFHQKADRRGYYAARPGQLPVVSHAILPYLLERRELRLVFALAEQLKERRCWSPPSFPAKYLCEGRFVLVEAVDDTGVAGDAGSALADEPSLPLSPSEAGAAPLSPGPAVSGSPPPSIAISSFRKASL